MRYKRLVVEKIIADCVRPAGTNPAKQLAWKSDTETRKALQRNPNAGEFIVEVTDVITTQKRRPEDRVS
jgi:hypothetical protein